MSVSDSTRNAGGARRRRLPREGTWKSLSLAERQRECLGLPGAILFTTDRREVIVNADGRPIFVRTFDDDTVHWADPNEKFDVQSTHWLYGPDNPPWRSEVTRQRVRKFLFELLVGGGRRRRKGGAR